MITRKAIWLFGSLLLIAALSLTSPLAKAQEGTPRGTIGVEAGDWANYDASALTYESNIPGYQEPPAELKVLASIEWFIGEVIEVTGNNVTMQWGSYYEDGTKQFETQTGDPMAGSGNLSDALAPGGLSPGRPIYHMVGGVGLSRPENGNDKRNNLTYLRWRRARG